MHNRAGDSVLPVLFESHGREQLYLKRYQSPPATYHFLPPSFAPLSSVSRPVERVVHRLERHRGGYLTQDAFAKQPERENLLHRYMQTNLERCSSTYRPYGSTIPGSSGCALWGLAQGKNICAILRESPAHKFYGWTKSSEDSSLIAERLCLLKLQE